MAVPLGLALQNLNSDDSDEDDDDYVPTACDESEDEVLDEVDSDEIHTSIKSSSEGKRKRKTQKSPKSRKRKGGIQLPDLDEGVAEEEKQSDDVEDESNLTLDPEKDKKKSDSLWADFLSDVTPPPSKKETKSTSNLSPKSTLLPGTLLTSTKPTSKPEKVTITKLFDFAGESVEVKEVVDANSQAAKEFALKQQADTTTPSSPSSSTPKFTPLSSKKPAGLGAVLGQVLGKKNKLSTLEKSKLDWNTFKKDEGVEDELEHYKKGKGGYLERQAFLQRADLREFEIEKQLRTVNRTHRV